MAPIQAYGKGAWINPNLWVGHWSTVLEVMKNVGSNIL